MNAPRRLRTLEESLSPVEAVLRWLAEARAFGGFGAYALASLEAPEAAAPLEQIIARVEAAARREHRGASRAALAEAIAADLEDALFRYELVLRLNADIAELVERLQPRLRILAALSAPAADAPSGQEGTAEGRTIPRGVDALPRAWQVQLDELVTIVAIEDEARALLEHRYLDGAQVLFADVAGGWRTLCTQVHEIAAGARRGPRSGLSNSLRRKAHARAGTVAADARLDALLALGEQARATELLRARVAAGGERTDPRLAVHVLERLSGPLAGRTSDERSGAGTNAPHPLDGLSPADQARQLRLLADELDGGPNP
jgi:hypothetical protein